MTEILEGAFDSVVSPRVVLKSKTNYKLGDTLHHWRPARTFSGVGPFQGDKLSMPGEYCVRGDDRGEPEEKLATKHLSFPREPSALAVIESESFPLVKFPKNAVLFKEILDDSLLVPVYPA